MEKRRLGRIRIQAFIYITDYRIEAGYFIGKKIKKAIKRGLFGFLYILKNKN
jgi:hypothetical protein